MAVRVVLDTNILVDYLNGVEKARHEIARYERPLISIVTWMELQIGSRTEAEADVIDLFLREFRVIEITRQVARRAVEIRRRTRVRLPDAIIWATAQMESAQLVTRNTKDFTKAPVPVHTPADLILLLDAAKP